MYSARGEVWKKQEILKRERGRGYKEEEEGVWAEGTLGQREGK